MKWKPMKCVQVPRGGLRLTWGSDGVDVTELIHQDSEGDQRNVRNKYIKQRFAF